MHALVAAATLIVRLYNPAAMSVEDLQLARETAGAILNAAGLTVAFRDCSAGGDACDEPLQPAEVVVRIIDAPAFSATLHPEAYGVTYVARDTNRGWLATAFADRITEAAGRAGTETGTLAGRVIAHEIGHLLLGAGYHGTAGLMRAEWPDAGLTRAADAWRFSPAESLRLHDALRF